MRYGCDNREHILDAMVGLLKQSPLPLCPGLSLADVPKKTNEKGSAELIAGSDRKLNRELCAITPNGRDLDPTI
jgi:hypothetical protein